MKKVIPLTRREQVLGIVFLLVQFLLLPSALALLSDNLPTPLTEGMQNALFFLFNFICVVLIFHRFLHRSWLEAKSHIFRVLRYGIWGFFLYYAGNYLISLWILDRFPDFMNVNDNSLAVLVSQQPVLMTIGTVFLVPVVEETLYRGLFFGSLYRIHPVLGYLISTILFGAIHVIGYIWQYDALTLLLCFCQYIPAGIFLGWAYTKSGTIWCPILIHMTINQIGMLLLR